MSLLDLNKRQNNMIISVRCDRRTLAGLHNYFTKHGEEFFSIGSLVNLTLENYMHMVRKEDKACDVLSVQDATEILKKFSRAKLNPQKRYEKTFLSQVEVETNIVSKYELGIDGSRSEALLDKQRKEIRREAEEIGPGIAERARVETEAETLKRRREEGQEQKDQLSKSPTNIASKYEGGNAPIIHNKDEE